MSFLSRRPSRSGNRASDAGRDDEHDDYEYAPDGYARGDQDDNWSANEYFSPEGIKGRWAAGHQPGDQPAVRGNRYEDAGDSFQGGGPSGYGTDAYATGAHDLPPGGAEDARGERGGRRRKDRAERGSRLRLRRDRGEDIWPEDGVSDEDYWASVAADRPLPPADAPSGADPVPAGGDSLPAAGGRPGGEGRFGGEPRGGTGRLGPAPGLVGDHQPASGGTWSGQAPRSSGGFPQPQNSGGFPQSGAAQPSFRPNSSGSRPGSSDWGDRTERIERVTATGYPDPRPNSRSGGAPGRGRTDTGREPGRNSGAWPAAARNSAPARAAGDEDPLTSAAYSRSAQSEADGRSYRVAARRSEAQAKLTEETQTFSAPVTYSSDRHPGDQYQSGQRPVGRAQTGEHPIPRYPTGMTGEYGQYMADTYSHSADKYGADKYGADQYRGGQQRGAADEPTARFPAYGSQPAQPAQPPQAARQQGQPTQPAQSAQPVGNSGRVSIPGASRALTGQYPAQQAQQPRPQQPPQPQPQPQQQQQPRQPQQRPQMQQPRPAAQPAQPAVPSGGNPYDSAVTGSYPYPGQAGYPSRSPQQQQQQQQQQPQAQAQAAPGVNGRDDRRRRPAPPDGYGTGSADHGAPRDGRY
jgi:hypothetical protein